MNHWPSDRTGRESMKKNDDEVVCTFEPGWGGPSFMVVQKNHGVLVEVTVTGQKEMENKRVILKMKIKPYTVEK